MSLGNFILNADESELKAFKKDIFDVYNFFKHISEDFKVIFDKFKNVKPGCEWNDENCSYTTFMIHLKRPVRIFDELEDHLIKYINENRKTWEKLFSNKSWFELNEIAKELSHHLWRNRTEKALCQFVIRVHLKVIKGESLENAIDQELNVLYKIRSPTLKRIQRVILQNIALVKDKNLEFKEKELKIPGREITILENGVERISRIDEFTAKFIIQLRRISHGDYEILTQKIGAFYLQQMNISTYLEIIYEFPNEYLVNYTLEISSKVEAFLNQIIISTVRSLKLSTGMYLHPVKLDPEDYNYYLKIFRQKIITFEKKNYLTYFYTPKIKLTLERFRVTHEIFELLWKYRANTKSNRIFTIIDRADESIQTGLIYISIIMYWTIVETILSGPKRYRAEQVGFLSGKKNKDDVKKVKDFWAKVYDIRNDYVHGDPFKVIENKLKKSYPEKDLLSFVLINREKMLRFILFTLLLSEYSQDHKDILQEKRKQFNYRPWINDKIFKIFHEWVQEGTVNELGLLDKYKPKRGLRLIKV